MSTFNQTRSFFHCPPNCPKRKPACQDTCPIHIEDKKNWNALKAKERQRKEIDYYVAERMANDVDARNKIQKSFGKSNYRRTMR